MRALLPVTSWASRVLGEENFEKLLSAEKIDSLIFANLENQVSHHFTMDLLMALVRHAGLKPDGLDEITRLVIKPQLHGSLRYDYDGQENREKLISALVTSCVYRDCNYFYRIENAKDSYLELSVEPHEHMREKGFISHFVLGDIACRYRLSFLEHFVNYGKAGNPMPAKVEKLDCIHRGGPKCVYRLPL